MAALTTAAKYKHELNAFFASVNKFHAAKQVGVAKKVWSKQQAEDLEVLHNAMQSLGYALNTLAQFEDERK